MDAEVILWTAKGLCIFVLYLFLPLTAMAYYRFRRKRREAEVERIFNVLEIDESYQNAYRDYPPQYLLHTLIYASVVSLLGFTLLFFGSDIGLAEFPQFALGDTQFPRFGSRFIFGMAFLGGYMWGLQYLFQRYTMNDLTPSVYFGISMRMILASVVALVIYNAFQMLSSTGSSSNQDVTTNIWPALAFLMGMFPQRGLQWLTDHIPMFAPETNATVRPAPLSMIEGITIEDRMRLSELGIDTCYDLATADFIPLILKTPYGARELVDWILQAKLCVYFGDAVKELRQHSIRTVLDLKLLAQNDHNNPFDPVKDEESWVQKQLDELALEAAVTRSALMRARDSIAQDPEIERLRSVANRLGQFTKGPTDTRQSP